MTRNIGVDVNPPRQICDDLYCPFHGKLPVRGIMIEGKVVNDKMQRTVTVEREYLKYNTKYKRYESKRSKIHAHNPPCIDAKIGDKVKIMECRPLGKTVSFVVIEKVSGKD